MGMRYIFASQDIFSVLPDFVAVTLGKKQSPHRRTVTQIPCAVFPMHFKRETGESMICASKKFKSKILIVSKTKGLFLSTVPLLGFFSVDNELLWLIAAGNHKEKR